MKKIKNYLSGIIVLFLGITFNSSVIAEPGLEGNNIPYIVVKINGLTGDQTISSCQMSFSFNHPGAGAGSNVYHLKVLDATNATCPAQSSACGMTPLLDIPDNTGSLTVTYDNNTAIATDPSGGITHASPSLIVGHHYIVIVCSEGTDPTFGWGGTKYCASFLYSGCPAGHVSHTTDTGTDVVVVNHPTYVPTPSITYDPCCPPWNKDLLASMMVYAGGTIGDPYTLHFQPTTLFNTQMNAYINYLHSLNPAIIRITMFWSLHEQGTLSSPTPAYGNQIGGPTVTVSWTGSGTPNVSGLFTGSPMQVGTWYCVHTAIFLNSSIKFYPPTCYNNDIYVRVQVLKSSTGPSLEISNGKKIIKTVPIKIK